MRAFLKNIPKLADLGRGRISREVFYGIFVCTKGRRLISKAIYGLLTSPQKLTIEFVLFAFLLFTANKSNSLVRPAGSPIYFSILSDIHLLKFCHSVSLVRDFEKTKQFFSAKRSFQNFHRIFYLGLEYVLGCRKVGIMRP